MKDLKLFFPIPLLAFLFLFFGRVDIAHAQTYQHPQGINFGFETGTTLGWTMINTGAYVTDCASAPDTGYALLSEYCLVAPRVGGNDLQAEQEFTVDQTGTLEIHWRVSGSSEQAPALIFYRIESDESETNLGGLLNWNAAPNMSAAVTAGDRIIVRLETRYSHGGANISPSWDDIDVYVENSTPPDSQGDDGLEVYYCVGAIIEGSTVYSTTLDSQASGAMSANVLDNHSFESGLIVPDSWDAQNPLTSADNFKTGGDARTGFGYLESSRSTTAQRYTQETSLPESMYMIGGFYYNTSTNLNGAVRLGIGSITLDPTASTNYTRAEAIVDNYGNLQFLVDVPEPSSPLDNFDFKFDDAFLVPVSITNPISGTTVINCDVVDQIHSQNQVTGTIVTTGTIQTVDGLPVPLFGAGKICYSCPYPPGRTDIGIYFAWLACIIRNMFSCDLWYWLAEIENNVLSVFAAVNYQTSWASVNAQGWINYWAGIVQGGIDFTYAMYTNVIASLNTGTIGQQQTATNLFDVLVALIDLPATIANAIVDGIGALGVLVSSSATLLAVIFNILSSLLSVVSVPIFAIIDMVLVVVDSLFAAINSPAITVEEFATLNGETIDTNDDIYVTFLLGVSYINSVFVDVPYLNWLLYIPMSLISLVFGLWFLREWRSFFSI